MFSMAKDGRWDAYLAKAVSYVKSVIMFMEPALHLMGIPSKRL